MAKISYDRGSRKQKLSWIYRKKKRLEKINNTSKSRVTDASEEKKGRIVVRNLSFQITEDDIKKFFGPFGEIKEINLLRHPDGKPVGCGFIQFARVEDASKAIFNTTKKKFLGRVIVSDWAIPKSKFYQKTEKLFIANQENGNDNNAELQTHENDDISVTPNKQKYKKRKLENRKVQKLKNRKKRARIIIRNLSFQITEDVLKNHFSQYGNIEDITILKKPDGKSIGCGFIQFERVQSAAKAIHYANLQPLLDRPIIVDWAVPKTKFSNEVNTKEGDTDIKENAHHDTEIKETHNVKSSVHNKLTEDLNSEDNKEENIEDDQSCTSDESDHDTKVENNFSNDDSEEKSDNVISTSDRKIKEENSKKIPKNDISEGKTVFLKNVPFSVKNEELKTCMEQFGPVYYALVCIDSLTEHSRGTAFVKFKNVEDAEKCLINEVVIRDQILEVHRALPKTDIYKQNSKEQKNRDSRNLYLIKEGVVAAGSSAAAEVSATDMAKRLQLEQWKTQILRNLNMFVSRVRLVVHNLPPSFDDARLRKLFKKYSGPKAIIREAKIMRDMKNIDATGIGKSKEYGFVTFTTHEDALRALRTLNNNPNIFTKHRRPIVAFSIENRVMVNARQKRLQKSREQNPLWPGNELKRKIENSEEDATIKHAKVEETDESHINPFMGVKSKVGNNKFRTRFNLKTQAVLHSQSLKKEKKKSKFARKLQEKQRDNKRKEVEGNHTTKKFTVNEADNFNNLVHNYKHKLTSNKHMKSKWYESAK